MLAGRQAVVEVDELDHLADEAGDSPDPRDVHQARRDQEIGVERRQRRVGDGDPLKADELGQARVDEERSEAREGGGSLGEDPVAAGVDPGETAVRRGRRGRRGTGPAAWSRAS